MRLLLQALRGARALHTVTPSAEVRAALARRGPVVALESTIITHGLPRPTNLRVARRLEQVVRDAGATPATVAILDGAVRVGLTEDELERVATRAGAPSDVAITRRESRNSTKTRHLKGVVSAQVATTDHAVKCSRRDLAAAVARSRADERVVGATTVAATAWAAREAGVGVFATGGLGGVWRPSGAAFETTTAARQQHPSRGRRPGPRMRSKTVSLRHFGPLTL